MIYRIILMIILGAQFSYCLADERKYVLVSEIIPKYATDLIVLVKEFNLPDGIRLVIFDRKRHGEIFRKESSGFTSMAHLSYSIDSWFDNVVLCQPRERAFLVGGYSERGRVNPVVFEKPFGGENGLIRGEKSDIEERVYGLTDEEWIHCYSQAIHKEQQTSSVFKTIEDKNLKQFLFEDQKNYPRYIDVFHQSETGSLYLGHDGSVTVWSPQPFVQSF